MTWPKVYSWFSSNAPLTTILPFSGAFTGKHFATGKQNKTKQINQREKQSL